MRRQAPLACIATGAGGGPQYHLPTAWTHQQLRVKHLNCAAGGPSTSHAYQHVPRRAAVATAAGDSFMDADTGGGRSSRHPDLLRVAQGSVSDDTSASSVSNDSSSSSRSPNRVLGGAVATTPASARASDPPRPEEVDERYRRADYSDVFQFESRQAFVRAIAGGEPRMRLAEAALHVTAEDDAIASLSTVRFPVEAWLERIDRLVDQLCAVNLRRAATAVSPSAPAAAADAHGGATSSSSPSSDAEAAAVAAEAGAVLRVVERYLWEDCGFRAPDYGRSNLPPNAVVDHAGVWEDARLGYLHETLVRRCGHPATLGLLLGDVCARLLDRGRLPCAAAVDTQNFQYLPRAVALPHLTRDVLVAAAQGDGSGGGPIGGLLNTCTSEVLVEMLRHLKRSYWPFAWDSNEQLDATYPGGGAASHGGFRSAAKLATGEEMSAALAAIAKVAAWRLERGIFTSPGAGDIRRARAACERLVLLAADRYPEERRDLAIILLHSGDVPAARREMRAYMRAVSPNPPGGGSIAGGSGTSSSTGRQTAATGIGSAAGAAAAGTGPGAGVPYWAGVGGPLGPDPFDLVLCRRLLSTLEGLGVGDEEAEEQGRVAEEPLCVEAALRMAPPWEQARQAGSKRALPLTW